MTTTSTIRCPAALATVALLAVFSNSGLWAQSHDLIHQPYQLDTGLVSRSISFENPTGAPGEAGQAASRLGPGRKLVRITHNSVPMEDMKTIIQSERELPVVDQADVVVAGGGIAGIAAALRAAESGHSVILLETRNYFGQEYTATYNCRTQLGLPDESAFLSRKMYEELTNRGILNGSSVNPIALRSYLHRKITDQPLIQVLFYSMATGVVTKGDQVHGVVFSGRDGRQVVLAKVVIDATEDARLAASAGAKMLRTMAGDKTARRFISVRLPESVPPGPLNIDGDSRLNDLRIVVHDGFVELELRASIGADVAGDHSRIQGQTLEKSFALRDYFVQQGWITLVEVEDYRTIFVPAPETYIDEGPTVACIDQFGNIEVKELNFTNTSAITPMGIQGLIVAGRTVDHRHLFSSLQVLFSIGTFAGKTASGMVAQTSDFQDFAISDKEISRKGDGIHIHELLDGVESGNDYPRILQSETELPVLGEYNVVVVGGGTSGSIAAISAARHGASVALLEILPNLGGIGSNRNRANYWGVPWKSLLRLTLGEKVQLSKGVAGNPEGSLEKVSYSGEDKKHALYEMATGAGVHVYFNSLGVGTVVEGRTVKGVVVENASGRHVLLSHAVVDATGHAGIAVAAGAAYSKGRSTDGFLHEIEHGPLRDPTHLGDISTSYVRSPIRQVSLNIRESRRISGDYTVSFEDVIHERIFPDVVCRWRSNYDTHFPSSANQSDLAQDWTAILGLWRRPILGSIPYRSLLPQGLDNILVAGMAYSTDHDALIGGRMNPDMEHLGEAAGVAAAMASKSGIPPRDIPVDELQVELVRLGVLRDEDIPWKTINGPSPEQLYKQDFWKKERDDEQLSSTVHKLPIEEMVLKLGTDEALECMVQLYLAGEDALPLLRPLLGSENQRVQEEAALLLGLLGDRSSVPFLMEFLKDRNPRQFEFSLSQSNSRPSVPLYWSAIILLGRLSEIDAVPLMLDVLTSPPSPEEFGMLTRPAYGVIMFENTETCPPPLASFLIVALGRIGDPSAADVIRSFLTVSNPIDDITKENVDFEISWGVQTNAAWALSQMGDLSGVPLLIELLDADQAMLRNYAQVLLEDISGEQFGRDRQAWKEWWEETRMHLRTSD